MAIMQYSIFRLSIFFIFLNSLLIAEEFTVEHPTKVGLKQQLVVKIKVVNSDSQPQLDSSDFSSSGQIGYSSSIQINGTSVNKTIAYQYALNPQKTGKSTFKVTVGKTVKGPFMVEVLQNNVQRQTQPTRSPIDSIFGGQTAVFKDNEAFVENTLKKNTYYVNEPIPVIKTIYYRVSISSPRLIKNDQYKGLGFEAQNQFDGRTTQITTNGLTYKATPVGAFVLFPHLPGKAKLKGGVLQLQKTISFFNRPTRDFKIPDQIITVKDFPSRGKPSDFTRAVGDFNFSIQFNSKKVKTHEPITLSLKISGRGNFNSIIPPKIKLTNEAITIKQSQIENKFSIKNGAHEGMKKVEYYLIPNKPGNYLVPEISFSFFNPNNRKYRTLKSKPQRLRVLKRSDQSQTSTAFSSINTQTIKLLKKDIRFIKTKPSQNSTDKITLTATLLFSCSILISLIFFISYLQRNELLLFRHSQQRNDLKKVKRQVKHLEKITSDEQFFSELQQLILGYLSKQFAISSGHSTAQIKKQFSTDKLRLPIINALMEIVSSCQSFQFAPKQIKENKKGLVKTTIDRLQDLENLSKGKQLL